jgi:hypothetical protein
MDLYNKATKIAVSRLTDRYSCKAAIGSLQRNVGSWHKGNAGSYHLGAAGVAAKYPHLSRGCIAWICHRASQGLRRAVGGGRPGAQAGGGHARECVSAPCHFHASNFALVRRSPSTPPMRHSSSQQLVDEIQRRTEEREEGAPAPAQDGGHEEDRW